MSANISPIFSKVGNIQFATAIAAAVTAITGVGSTMVFTADATNGSRVEKVRFRALGTNVATVARVFIVNASGNGSAANCTLWDEITLPATTLSQVAALANQEIYLGFALPPGFGIAVTLGTTVAAGYDVTCIGGTY